MTTAMDRGWDDPRDPNYREAHIVPVTVGPFPAKGPLKKVHPKVTINFHKDAAFLLQGFLTEIITRGFRLDGPQLDDWGYICRPIRGYELKYKLTRLIRFLSNHSWGLAADLNAAQYPLGSPNRVPDWVVEAGRRWGFEYGGDYTHRPDGMHWEITMTRSACVQKVADLEHLFGIKAA